VVVADHQHHEVLVAGSRGRARRRLATMLLHPLLGLGGGAVVHGELVALRLEVPGHGETHDTEAEERDFRGHFFLLNDQLTGFGGSLPSSTAMRLAAAVWHIMSRVAREALPMCGVRTTLSSPRYPGCTRGSP